MGKILAKSCGIDLITHSRNVERVAFKLLLKSVNEPTEKKKEIIKLSALLHDIGKCTETFQKLLSGKIKKSKNKFRHNEIGWAFLYRYLHVDSDVLKEVLDAIYWHHGISNKMGDNNQFQILDSVLESDIEAMKNFLLEVLGKEYFLDVPRDSDNYNSKSTPKYYNKEEVDLFQNYLINRTCLISADRIASNLEEKGSFSELDTVIENILNKKNSYKITEVPTHYAERFAVQRAIANTCTKTSIVKGPAGFGKTNVGLEFGSLNDKKIIWVCPRNMVASSVYDSLIKELKVFNLDVSVELYLSGNVKASNCNATDGFSSDIIVTNIDNFLAPSVDSRNADKLFMINNVNVIFDEYHELVCESALFSAFVNIMRVRNRITDSKTLMLSATPTRMEFLWDSISQQTLVLPNKHQHYKAAHDKKYRLNILDELESVEDKNSLIIFNAIAQAQINKTRFNCHDILHSQFIEKALTKKFFDLLDNYGKDSDATIAKNNLIATHIVQASLDISFNHLYESVLSPESTLQRIGRCDRWGYYNGIPCINIFKANNNSENKVRETLYSRNISDTWFDFLKEYNATELDLNELYVLYNKFAIDNEKMLERFIRDKFNDSLKKLESIHPMKFTEDIETDVISAGGNKLRSVGNEIFFIAQIDGTNEYTDVFNTRIYQSIDKDFDESDNPLPRIKGVYNSLIKSNDKRFEFNDIMDNKNITLDGIRRYARKSNTPYVRFDKVYHEEYGLINKIILEKIFGR